MINHLEVFAVVLSFLALGFSVYAFWSSRKHSVVEITHNLHQRLFDDGYIYEYLYRNDKVIADYFFNVDRSDEPGNFLGTELEYKLDGLLENMNFVCFWLLETDIGQGEEIFRKYIHMTLETRLVRHYLKFLTTVESIEISGEYYPFIRKYAAQRLMLTFDDVSFQTAPSDTS